MEHVVVFPAAGVLARLHVARGAQVAVGAVPRRRRTRTGRRAAAGGESMHVPVDPDVKEHTA